MNVQRKIQQWKDGLADLSRRNRLLHFRPDKLSTITVLTPAREIYESLIQEREPIELATLEADHSEAELTKYLKKLRQTANSTLEEKGVNSLFVAIGTLTWVEVNPNKPQDPLVSPVFLIPVELRKKPKKEEYTLHPHQEDAFFNPILVQKLKGDYGISIPEVLTAAEDEESGIPNYERFLDILRDALVGQPTWQLDQTAYIGLFSYAKAVMIQDLMQNEHLIAAHPILRALSGDLSAHRANTPETIDEKKIGGGKLDDFINPELIFQVLEADSSQQVVIEAAKAGLSFTVQGPPGTGKSQTIANIIAELAGMGKRVLLVAEKETALEVVFKRLRDDCGLGDLCLNLHHKGTTDKKAMIAELVRTKIQFEEFSDPENQSSFFRQLRSRKKKVNAHTVRLHQKWEPINKSAFELYGELLKRADIPEVIFAISNITEWSNPRLEKIQGRLKALSHFCDFLQSKREPIWAKSYIKAYSFEFQQNSIRKIDLLQAAIKSAAIAVANLSKLLGTDMPQTLEKVNNLYETAHHVASAKTIPSRWLKNPDIDSLRQLLVSLKLEVKDIEKLYAFLNSKYRVSDLLTSDLAELAERYCRYNFFSWIFDSNHKRDRKRILAYRKNGEASDDELISDLKKAVELQKLKHQLIEPTHPAQTAFGSLFKGEASDFQAIQIAIDWLERLQVCNLSGDVVQRLITSNEHRQKLEHRTTELQAAQRKIEEGFEFLRQNFPERVVCESEESLSRIPLARITKFLERARIDIDSFQNWLEYSKIIQELSSFGAASFVERLREPSFSVNEWFPVLEKRIYQLWLEYIHTQESELRNFQVDLHEQAIREFSQLDTQQLEIAQERLRYTHAKRWLNWSAKDSAGKEVQLLNKEYLKKKRHLSIRRFIERAPNLVAALKPCWLMSPLAVSQYINPHKMRFDVVLFDEASQIRTEDAVPTIMRSKQVIVVGDNKQLPPTDFFSGTAASSEDEEEDELEDSYESILDECSIFMQQRSLKWHYRSRDESLITFSNHHFYDNKLVTFPNAVKDHNHGVHFHFVADGVYDRGGKRNNIREAQEVVNLILNHVRSTPDQTLGVIGFSSAQTEAIQNQMERLCPDHPELDQFCDENTPNFFLKPLERVQGDERDVIILSVGYGKDQHGRLYYNFGPINQSSRRVGERRLNVAVTRAKYKLILVSSIQDFDLDLSQTSNKGVERLKDYLSYAASGGQKIEENHYDKSLQPASPFEEDVYSSLSERGYTLRSQVGCSSYRIDLAVVDNERPGEFLLGIECDGATYHSSPTARDRDRLRQRVLEGLGWRIYRIWSRDYFRDKPGQIERLVEQIEQLRNQPRPQAVVQSFITSSSSSSVSDSDVTVLNQNSPTQTDAVSLACQQILKVLAQGTSHSKSELLEITGTDESLWRPVIQKLIGSGHITSEGKGRGTRYRIP